ncbi:MAG TPA: molybdate ABC transporter substrate-binding protein [Micromonospora sp.]
MRRLSRHPAPGPRWLAALATVVVLVVAGCSAEPAGRRSGGGTLTVLAAASLTDAFTRIARDFEATRPGVAVSLSFAGSSQLAQQITSGAPADVFAAASPATMRTVTDALTGAGQPRIFARNQLVIAVPPGNPQRIAGLADLTRPGLKVALCAPQVPCGAAAGDVLAAGKVELRPVTLERDVRATLTKVELGEVDAALVYRTDVRAAAGRVDGVEFPDSAAAVNDYPILPLPSAADPATAEAFVGYVLSDRGRSVLEAAGFQLP